MSKTPCFIVFLKSPPPKFRCESSHPKFRGSGLIGQVLQETVLGRSQINCASASPLTSTKRGFAPGRAFVSVAMPANSELVREERVFICERNRG